MNANKTAWFVAGLVVIALLSEYAPRLAGAVVVLLAVYLGVRYADPSIVSA